MQTDKLFYDNFSLRVFIKVVKENHNHCRLTAHSLISSCSAQSGMYGVSRGDISLSLFYTIHPSVTLELKL